MNEKAAGKCLVLGGGGHGRVVIDALRLARPDLEIAVLDVDAALLGASVLGALVLGDDGFLGQARQRGYGWFTVGMGSIKYNARRQALFARGLAAALAPVNVVHPSAVVSPGARIGRGVQVLAAAVVNVGAELGDNVIVNSGAIIDQGCRIGGFSHIGPGAVVCGGAGVGELASICAGAVLREGVMIGAEALVAGGAVVLGDVGPGVRVAGVPAKPYRATPPFGPFFPSPR